MKAKEKIGHTPTTWTMVQRAKVLNDIFKRVCALHGSQEES